MSDDTELDKLLISIIRATDMSSNWTYGDVMARRGTLRVPKKTQDDAANFAIRSWRDDPSGDLYFEIAPRK